MGRGALSSQHRRSSGLIGGRDRESPWSSKPELRGGARYNTDFKMKTTRMR